MPANVCQDSGFTLIEIVAVLVLLGALGTVVASRVVSVTEFESIGELAKLKTHLRNAF